MLKGIHNIDMKKISPCKNYLVKIFSHFVILEPQSLIFNTVGNLLLKDEKQ